MTQSRRHIIIGDIHGCVKELNELLHMVGPIRSNDSLVLCGDLINKGPDSIGVLSRLWQMKTDGCNVTYVRGNHEDKLLRFLVHQEREAASNVKNPMLNSTIESDLAEKLNGDLVEFMRSSVLFHKIPDQGLIVVHAGIPSSLKALPINIKSMSSRDRNKALELLRLRYEDHNGQMVKMKDLNTDKHAFWATKYDGRFGHVVFGHHNEKDNGAPLKFDNATGIDTGCVYGNKLTALVIENNESNFITVSAKNTYF